MSQNTNVGTISLRTVLDRTGFNRQMSNFQNTVGSQMKKIGLLVSGYLSGRALVSFGKDCIELGSDLSEVQNVVDTTFTTMNEKVNQFAKAAKSSFGLSETMAKRYVGTLGAMATAYGLTEKQSYDMATSLAGLTADVASFYNLDQDVAFTKLKAVFTGETEGLKDLGVVMTQTALDQYAMNNGFGKTTANMTEQEKVMLRYQFVMDRLSKAQGDFSKTSTGWANKMRILNLRIETLKANIGQGLINVFNKIIPYINLMIEKITVLSEKFMNMTNSIFGEAQTGKISNTSANLYYTVGSISAVGDEAEKSQEKVERFVAGFDKLNKVSSNDTTTNSTDTGGVSDLTNTNNELNNTNEQVGGISKKLDILKKSVSDYLSSLKNVGGFFKQLGSDFGEYFVSPLVNFSISENGLPRLLNIMSRFNNEVKWDKINNGFKNIFIYSEKIAEISWDYLMDLLDYFLEPLARWAMNNLIPVVLELIGESLELIGQVLKALNPLFEWLLKNILEPLAELIGDTVVGVLKILLNILKSITDWISNHEELFKNLVTFVTTFFLAFKGVNFIVSTIQAIGSFGNVATILVQTCLNIAAGIGTVIGAINPWIVVIAAVIAAVVLLAMNWDKVKEFAMNTIENIKNGLVNLKDGAIAKFEELKSWWSTTPTWVQEIGNAIYINMTSPINTVRQFFSDLWTDLKTMSENGTLTIGNIIKSVLTASLNSMMTFIESTINGCVSMINGVSGAFSKVSGVEIGKLNNVKLPRFANGGYVPAQGQNGGVLSVIGDVKKSDGGEYVLRKDQLQGLLEENSINTARAISSLGGINNNNGTETINLTLNMDGEPFFNKMVNINNHKTMKTGNKVI